VFDLGGVIIDLDFGRVFDRWAVLSGRSAETLRRRFEFDEAYERHERGEIGASEYFRGVGASLGIDLTPTELADGWNCVYVGPFPGVADLLADLATQLPIFGFTNSNPTHEEVWSERYRTELAPFESIFVSSTIGRRKPEREAFEYVADQVGRTIGAIHFFDDSVENVEGARSAGMPATLVTSFEGLEAAIRRLT